MKRRLRKKKRKGEFAEWGVSVVARFCSTQTLSSNQVGVGSDALKTNPNVNEVMDRVMDEFIEFLESRGWYCGGSISPKGEFDFIVEFGRDDGCLAQHRQTLETWLKDNAYLDEVVVGRAIDLWYPPNDIK